MPVLAGYVKALKTLAVVAKNVVKDPANPKYRSLPVHGKLEGRLGRWPSAVLCLQEMGFQAVPTANAGDEVDPDDAKSADKAAHAFLHMKLADEHVKTDRLSSCVVLAVSGWVGCAGLS